MDKMSDYKLIDPGLADIVAKLQRIAQRAEDAGLFRATDDEDLRSALDHLVTDVQCACGMQPRRSQPANK